MNSYGIWTWKQANTSERSFHTTEQLKLPTENRNIYIKIQPSQLFNRCRREMLIALFCAFRADVIWAEMLYWSAMMFSQFIQRCRSYILTLFVYMTCEDSLSVYKEWRNSHFIGLQNWFLIFRLSFLMWIAPLYLIIITLLQLTLCCLFRDFALCGERQGTLSPWPLPPLKRWTKLLLGFASPKQISTLPIIPHSAFLIPNYFSKCYVTIDRWHKV